LSAHAQPTESPHLAAAAPAPSASEGDPTPKPRTSTLKILLVAIGSSGDVHPLIGVGCALRNRGHDVTIVSSVHFERQVTGASLGFIGVGTEEEYEAITSDPALMQPIRGTKRVIEYCCVRTIRDIYDIIAQHDEPGRTVVISCALAVGARIAQEHLDVPLITTILQPMMFRSTHATPRYDWLPMGAWTPAFIKSLAFRAADVYADSIAAPATNAFRKELGLPPARRLFHHWWMSPQRVIGLFPEWYGPMQPDWPANTTLTGFPLYDGGDTTPIPVEAQEFFDNGDPPIVFTPGTAMRFGKRFFTSAAEACAILGRRGVLLSRFTEHIPSKLPPGVVHFDYLPLGRVLKRAAAMVHHGGMGTLAQTLRAGIPHLVMPMSIDQPDNAARLRRLGVADSLTPRRFRPEAVAGKLQRLLSSSEVKAACRRVARRFEDCDARTQTCEVIESFAAEVM